MKKHYTYLITNILVAAFWSYFAWTFFLSFQITHKPSTLVFLIAESFSVLLFLTRRDPFQVSKNPTDWFWALCGTFITMLYRPSSGIFVVGEALLIVGVVFQIASFAGLNRSFGIVPANRGVKTTGVYRFIRHPMYLSSMIFSTGYFLANISLWNGLVLSLLFFAQIRRIINEEAFFSREENYQAYREKVKWRLIPLVF